MTADEQQEKTEKLINVLGGYQEQRALSASIYKIGLHEDNRLDALLDLSLITDSKEVDDYIKQKDITVNQPVALLKNNVTRIVATQNVYPEGYNLAELYAAVLLFIMRHNNLDKRYTYNSSMNITPLAETLFTPRSNPARAV